MAAITHFPKTRLSEMVQRLGGISREDAVANARTELESMRAKSDAVIGESLSALEAIAYKPASREGHSPEQMREILTICDQVVTLAGTFGYGALDKATRSLCDVADGLLQSVRGDAASVMVHAQAMRMVAPGAPPLSAEQAEKMLSELAKIKSKYGFQSLGEQADSVSIEANVAPGANAVG